VKIRYGSNLYVHGSNLYVHGYCCIYSIQVLSEVLNHTTSTQHNRDLRTENTQGS